jgi:DNA-binding Lrp family transcriptional regulator
MDTENILKSSLLKLLNEGKSEVEAIKEISKSRSSYEVVRKNADKWLEDFRSGNCNLIDKASDDPNEKLTDEQIMDLINKNPDLSLEKISRLAKCSTSTIRDRINKLKNSGKSVNYSKKNGSKFTDEYLIGLINKNPGLSIRQIAIQANIPPTTMRDRIKKLNNRGESVVYHKKETKKFTDEYLIEFVEKNPDLNMSEIARLLDTTQNSISTRIKKIRSEGKTIKYTNKNFPELRLKANLKPNPKLTDEYLIKLINENPDLSMNKLAVLADTSPVTLAKRIRQINSDGERVAYRRKRNEKIPDEQVINLVNENPDLSIAKLANLANTSATTIYNSINRINRDGEKANYRKKDNKKFSDEHLMELINNNPDLSLERLATLADTSFVTVYNRFKEINNDEERAKHANKKT